MNLPIDGHLGAIVTALQNHVAVVVTAAPGAGKTTRVPPALLDAQVVPGDVIVLEPRRVAARSVARRIAQERGGRLGDEIGFQVRFERVGGAKTRLWVVTEGILTRRLQADPLLEGVGVVVLDEFHERSVHADLCIAFLREVLDARDDLRVVVMSATVDAGPIASFLGGAPVIDCPGRVFPVTTRYAGHVPAVDGAVDAVVGLLEDAHDDGGDVLVFMPGAREIDDTVTRLRQRAAGVDVLGLHGSMPPAAQDEALRGEGRRRVIVATNIAETSLTIPRVTAVVDCGLVRQLEADVASGVDVLVTKQVSLASATQRAGRAGRIAPGRVVRLWAAVDEPRMAAWDVPELHRIDLCGPVLDVAGWGAIEGFGWFEPPPPARLAKAVELLEMLGCLEDRKISPLGVKVRERPLPPRIAVMLEAGIARGCAKTVAELAAILSEPDFVNVDGRSPAAQSDLLERWRCLRAYAQGRANEVRRSGFEVHATRAHATLKAAEQLGRGLTDTDDQDLQNNALKATMTGFPDRIGLRRTRNFALSGGGAATLGPESLVREADCVVAYNLFGTSRDGEFVIRMASALSPDWLEEVFPGRVSMRKELAFDETLERVVARSVRRFWQLPLATATASIGPQESEDAAQILAEAIAQRVSNGRMMPELSARIAFLRAHCPELEMPDPSQALELWAAVCWGKRSLKELPSLEASFLGTLSDKQRRALETEAPVRLEVPSGSNIALAYDQGNAPVLAVRLQEVFGWGQTPRLAFGRVPILLHLLAPNYRPTQVTDDLQSFWSNTYPQVRKELRARYPKHPWPEDPWTARAIRK